MNFDDIKEIIKILEEKKLKSVEAFDLKGKSELVKFIVLATSPNEKNARALSYDIEAELKEKGIDIQREGDFPGEWIILDAGEFMIEIFTEDARKYYNLEKLWGTSKNRFIEKQLKKRKKNS